jgi:hypothetical protein
MKFTVYKTSSGRLGAHYEAPNPQEQCMPGECAVEGWHDQLTHYVRDAEVIPRPPHPCQIDKTQIHANGVDQCIIAGIRPGSDVSIDGPIGAESPIRETHRVDDGQIEIVVALPGEYRISVECFPYLDWEVAIHAD